VVFFLKSKIRPEGGFLILLIYNKGPLDEDCAATVDMGERGVSG
jgi:hypothetical protein